jgi:hypothetical protein
VTGPEQQDDLTGEPGEQLVEQTDNGLRPDDPVEQPSQDPAELPAGTETLLGVVEDGPK